MCHKKIDFDYQAKIQTFVLACTFLILALYANQSHAEVDSSDQTATLSDSNKVTYTIGMRLKSNDIAEWQHSAKIRPVIGLKYGKWRLGIGDGQAWQGSTQFGSEPALSYQLLDDANLDVGVSMRIHNISTGESFDVFEGGQKTLRSRVMLKHKINRYLRTSFDWTQDILNQGDSTTLHFDLSYFWPVFKQSEFVVSMGTTWATAEHWRNSEARVNSNSSMPFKTGFEKINAGLTFKQAISRQWAWYSSFGVCRPIADLARITGNREFVSGQIGILYFQR